MRAINRYHRVFILICFPLQNSFRSGHNSKKQSHIFYFLIDFRSSRSLISFRSRRTFFKKHWNVCRSSHTIFNIKKYIRKQLHIFFQKQYFNDIFSEAAARSLKKHWNVYGSSYTIFNIKNISCTVSAQNMLKQLHIFLSKTVAQSSRFLHKMYWRFFHNL